MPYMFQKMKKKAQKGLLLGSSDGLSIPLGLQLE